jgi:hypothetical protein
MAKLEEYRDRVRQILIKYSQSKPSYGEVENELPRCKQTGYQN